MHLRFTHIAVCIGAFFGVAEYHFTVCLCHDLLIHSPGEGRLGCFQCLVVAEEKAAINITVRFWHKYGFCFIWINT